MPSALFSFTAAQAAVNADIFSIGGGLACKQAQKGNGVPRRIHAIGVTGSLAAGDFRFDLYAGSKYLGSFANTTAGASTIPKMDSDLQPVYSEDYIGAGQDLIGIVNDAAATNDVFVLISWEDKQQSAGFATDKMVLSGGPRRMSGYSQAPRRSSYRGGRSGYRRRRQY